MRNNKNSALLLLLSRDILTFALTHTSYSSPSFPTGILRPPVCPDHPVNARRNRTTFRSHELKKKGRKSSVVTHTRRTAFPPQPGGRRIHAPGRRSTQPCASPAVEWTAGKHHPRWLSHAQKPPWLFGCPVERQPSPSESACCNVKRRADRTRRTGRVGPKGG